MYYTITKGKGSMQGFQTQNRRELRRFQEKFPKVYNMTPTGD